jgi:hypothetical protein
LVDNSAITQHQGALLQLEELVGEPLNTDLLIENISTNYRVDGKSLPEESPCLMRRSILFCKDSCSCLLTENALRFK